MSQISLRDSSALASDTCYHCGDKLRGKVYYSTIENQQQPMCCIGCQAAANMIAEAGMSDYYHQREALPSPSPAQSFDEQYWQHFDQPNIATQYLKYTDSSTIVSAAIKVDEIYCSACSWLIERSYHQLSGLEELNINLSQKRLRLSWNVEEHSFSDILMVLARLGYQPKPLSVFGQIDSLQTEQYSAIKRIAVAGLGMMQVMGFAFALYADESSQSMDQQTQHFLNLVSLLVATAVVFYSGTPFFKNAFRDLRSSHLGMDVPVAIAIATAYSSSIWATFSRNGSTIYFDSAVMFIFFLSLGRYMELRIRHQSLSSSEALGQLLPAIVKIQRAGKELTLTPSELQRGDLIHLQAGDICPCDADIYSGSGRFDESLLTGEAYSLQREQGDSVIGGSQLCSGSVEVSVRQQGQDSTLAKISQLLDKAQSQRPQQSLLADHIAKYFVITILSIACLVGIIWWHIDSSRTLSIVLSVLVVTCPCALSLATPAAITAISHRLSRQGIVLSNSNALQTLTLVNHWCFDKTGTLTTGKMSLSDINITGSLNKDECLAIAYQLEKPSSHPLAQAFTEHHLASNADKLETPTLEQWQEIAGNGVTASIGHWQYYLGRHSWSTTSANIKDHLKPTGNTGTEVVLSRSQANGDGEVLAYFYATDTLRNHTKETLDSLKDPITLLSGDNQDSVTATAEQLTIHNYRAGLQPDEKLAVLKDLQQHHTVAMVGDGINDAPTLAGADISISLSSATQLAQSHADVLILNNRISSIHTVYQAAQQCQRIIKQNLSWAALYNLSALPLAAIGILSPWMAALGMSASSLLVVLNASRLNSTTHREH